MYEIVQRLGYSHCDANGRVSPVSVMNMLQDIGGYFSEDYDIGENYLLENDLGWIVYNWNIEFLIEPSIYNTDRLTIGTLVYEYKGSVCNRYYEVKDKKNQVLVKAYATWVLIKRSTGHPTRLTKKIIQAVEKDNDFHNLHEKIEKCILPPGLLCAEETEHFVPLAYIDIRGHMNNARYLEVLQEILDNYSIDKIYINYQIPLLYRQKFIIRKYLSEKTVFIEFMTSDANKESEETACVMKVLCR